ncbi:MAG TPA: nucleoside triphosphate pyrophosphohydrolase [Firmicutes bacterium]|nr:nucleoside triphosphate pyrophosphohydrolase [Bacillota bacterium]
MKTIYVVGLGPGEPQSVTLQGLAALQQAKRVYARTKHHPGLRILHHYRIPYKALDIFYEKGCTFSETYRNIARYVLRAACRFGEVAYAVPGSPSCAEKTVQLIRKQAGRYGITCRILPAVSFLEAVAAELQLPQLTALHVADALQPESLLACPEKYKVIIQAYNRQVASTVKLQLLSLYSPAHPVTAIRGAGLKRGKKVATIPLYAMDRLPFIDHLTTFCLPPRQKHGLHDLLQVMRKLRGKGGCPWDREQDHRSLRPYLLEEAYEVLGALEKGDMDEVCEELGDLLLQVVFHSEIAAEEGHFTFYDVVAGITEKLIRRHPHVFAGAKAENVVAVLRNWQQLKKAEKKERRSLFTLETFLPALLRAQKLQRQAASVGFDWPDITGAWDKLQEELKELNDAYKNDGEARIEEELGDLLFAVVNVARFLQVDAEQALAASTQKFFNRLRFVEEKARAEGGEMSSFPLAKLDEWWECAKKHESG